MAEDEEEYEEIKLLNEKGETKSVTRKKIKDLCKTVDESYLELGRHLYNAYYGDYWDDWGFESFEDYCMEELGFAERKAKYLFTIWKRFQVDLGIAKAKLEKIGWTKASRIVGIVDEKNVEKWLDRARTLKVRELEKAISKYKGSPGADEDWHVINFKLAEEQHENVQAALAQAEAESGSDKRGHNLDLICTEWRTSRLGPKDKLPHALKGVERAFGVRVVSIKSPDLFKKVVKFIDAERKAKKAAKVGEAPKPKVEAKPAPKTKAKIEKRPSTKAKVKKEASASTDAGTPVKKAPARKKKVKAAAPAPKPEPEEAVAATA